VTAITYLAWFALIRDYPASLLSSFTFLTPLFGVAFGAALLREPLSPQLLAALLLVAVGIYLVNRGPSRHPAEAQAG
jgi:drug/metabolite transporter (DMT)-like permease